jgi:hypothetical protein
MDERLRKIIDVTAVVLFFVFRLLLILFTEVTTTGL